MVVDVEGFELPNPTNIHLCLSSISYPHSTSSPFGSPQT